MLTMKKVMVVGSGGAGKSTFSRRLHDLTGLPLYHLDMIYHKPDKTTLTRAEFDERLAELVAQDTWIIDGNYSRTLEMRMRECDTVFLLDFPVEVCLAGVRDRIGKPREDMPWIESQEDPEFMQWIRDFPTNGLLRIYELIDKYKDRVQAVIFRSREELEGYLNFL